MYIFLSFKFIKSINCNIDSFLIIFDFTLFTFFFRTFENYIISFNLSDENNVRFVASY